MAERALRLRPVRVDDEDQFVAAHRALQAESFNFGLGYELGEPFADYVARVAGWPDGNNVPANFVRSALLVADVNGVIVGRASIRYALGNEFLSREGGHIGYGVLAEHRRRGYATEILRQSLVITRSLGIDRALVTCADDNIGSASVIERCGGVFESLTENTENPQGAPKRRYWID